MAQDKNARVIELLANFKDSFQQLNNCWCDDSSNEINEILSGNSYPFGKSFDDLTYEVNEWVGGCLMDLNYKEDEYEKEYDFITIMNRCFGQWYTDNSNFGGCKVWKVGGNIATYNGDFLLYDDDNNVLVSQFRYSDSDDNKIVTSFEIDKDDIEAFFNREFLVRELGRGGVYNTIALNILMADGNDITLMDTENEGSCFYGFLATSEIGDTYELYNMEYTRTK